jgi:hypothetical protein
MGTDVHAVIQVRSTNSQPWKSVPLPGWDQGRHYFLFAWLADVRNGKGFAGIVTGEAIRPLSAPRGIPPDFEMSEDTHPCSWVTARETFRRYHRYAIDGERLKEPQEIQPGDPDEFYYTEEEWRVEAGEEGYHKPGIWMGDHSHSWLMSDQILNPQNRPGKHVREGLVGRDSYLMWKASGDVNPRSWCGGAGGNIVDEPEGGYDLDGWMGPDIPKDVDYIRCIWTDPDDGLQEFVDAIQAVCDEYPSASVRLVFGFDS